MLFHVSRGGRQFGPYTPEAIRSYLSDGSLVSSDKVCEEGGSVWRPLGEVFPPNGASPRPLAETTTGSRKTPPLPPDERVVPLTQPLTSQHISRRSAPFLLVGLIIISLAAGWFYLRPSAPILLLEGSTTIGDSLASELLKSFLHSEGASAIEDVQQSERGSARRQVRATLSGDRRSTTYDIVANGSGNAFKALAARRAEIGMASRPINDEEYRSLLPRGDLRSPESESIVALDGLAIIVNKANPVEGLSRQQLASLFGGGIRDWSRVGGAPGPVHLYGRTASSGTFDTFVSLVFDGDKKGFSPTLQTLDNGEAIAGTVAADPGGIGYVALAQIASAKPLEISDGAGTTPLLPSAFTVATEDYLLSRRLFLYSLPTHSDFAARFIAYALGPEGQAIVEKVGFVKQTPALEVVDVPLSAPTAYRRETAGLRRMGLNFRFRPDSVQLDNKALADLPRALSVFHQLGVRTGVAVLGFADSRGTAAQNQRLSEQRARVVGAKLQAYGIEVKPVGFSSAMPVADNNTAEGRDKNRRVEIWSK